MLVTVFFIRTFLLYFIVLTYKEDINHHNSIRAIWYLGKDEQYGIQFGQISTTTVWNERRVKDNDDLQELDRRRN